LFFSSPQFFSSIARPGILVPSSGKRLRAEFVYRAVVQCADEIRRRGNKSRLQREYLGRATTRLLLMCNQEEPGTSY